jgi:hypothetical protein
MSLEDLFQESVLCIKPVVPKTTCDSLALLFGQGNSLSAATEKVIRTDTTDLLFTTYKSRKNRHRDQKKNYGELMKSEPLIMFFQ